MEKTAYDQKISSMTVRRPHACSYSYCNHRAGIALGKLFHELFGAHHGGHRQPKTKNR